MTRRLLVGVALVLLAMAAVFVVTYERSEPGEQKPEPDRSDRAADAGLIVDLWENLERSSQSGLDAWARTLVDSQYPGFGATVEVCTHGATGGDDFQVAYDIDPSTIERVTGWTVPDFSPGSPLSGETPDGRIYSVELHTTFGSGPQTHVTTEYATVRGGQAYRFPICETE